MKLKILFFISDLGSGGTQRSLLYLTDYLISKNYDVKIVVLNKKIKQFYKYSKKIEIIYLENVNHKNNIFDKIISNIKKIYLIKKITQKHKSHYCISMLSQTNVIVLLASIFNNHSKIILCERNDPYKQKFNIYWKFLIRYTYKYADCICVNSPNAFKFFSKFINKNKLKITLNHIEFKNLNKNITKEKIILAVGRINFQKGYDILINAFKESDAHHKGWCLKIVGNFSDINYYQKLKELSKNYINKSIFIIDEVQNIEKIYSQSSAYIIASRFEGTPNSFLEAASMSMPCIVSDSINLGDKFLIDKENVILFNSQNIESCKKSINFLINNYKTALKYGNNLKSLILRKYSLKEANSSWDEIIKT